MKKINLKTTSGIIIALENTINDVKEDVADMKKADLLLRGCKHAIQVFALSLDYAKFKNIDKPNLPIIRLDEE